eukprot:scaffold52126_cov21-Tisochrysis_lutea.AAC.3
MHLNAVGLNLARQAAAILAWLWTQLVQACGSHPGMAVALGDPIATTQSPSNKAIDAGSSRTSCTPHAPPACGEIRQSSCNSRDAELGSRTGKQSVRSAACGSSAHAAVDSKSDRGGSGVPQSQPSRHALFEEKSAVHDCQEAGGAAAHWQELIGQTSHTRVDGSTQIPTTNTAPGTTTTTTSGTATAPQTPGNAAATAPAPAAASRPCHTGGSVEEFATAAGSAEERAAAAAAAQSAEKRATANGLGVERAIADGSAEERATVARSAEEHATVDGSSKENAEPSTSTSPAHASSKSLPVLGRAQRAAALHLAISAAASDLSRPALAEVAMAAAWPSGLLALLCAGWVGVWVASRVFLAARKFEKSDKPHTPKSGTGNAPAPSLWPALSFVKRTMHPPSGLHCHSPVPFGNVAVSHRRSVLMQSCGVRQGGCMRVCSSTAVKEAPRRLVLGARGAWPLCPPGTLWVCVEEGKRLGKH